MVAPTGKVFRFRAKVSSGNSAFNPSPNIDYDLVIEAAEKGNYRVSGLWDGFPTTEIFIEDTESRDIDLVFYNETIDARQTIVPSEILKLFDLYGDIRINILDDFGNKPFVENRTPYPDVIPMSDLFNYQFQD